MIQSRSIGINKSINISQQLSEEQQHTIRETVLKEQKRLMNFIRQQVPTEEDAEDVLQDVFYQFTQGFDTIESIDKATSWLFRVARNRITDLFRKKKPVTFSTIQPEQKDSEEKTLMLEDILPDLSNAPDALYLRSLVWEAIQEAIDALPEKQRQVFVLHEFEDKSFKDISEITGASVNTLLSRKRYAILFLRERLQDLYDELVN